MSFIQDMIIEAREDDIFTLADRIQSSYNGAMARGERIPEAVPGCINQINLPDNMRLKHLSVEPVNEDTINISYITQEPFSEDDYKVFEKEMESMLREVTKNEKNPIFFSIEAECRDGQDYGYGLSEFTTGLKESLEDDDYDFLMDDEVIFCDECGERLSKTKKGTYACKHCEPQFFSESVMPNRSEWGTTTVKEIGDYVIRKSVEFDGTTYSVFKDWDEDSEIGKYIDTFMTEEEAENCINSLLDNINESVEASFIAKPFNMKWHYGDNEWDDNSAVIVIPNVIEFRNVNGKKDSMDAPVNCYDKDNKLIRFNTVEEAEDYISKYLDTREARLEQNNNGTFSAFISDEEELTEAVKTIDGPNGSKWLKEDDLWYPATYADGYQSLEDLNLSQEILDYMDDWFGMDVMVGQTPDKTIMLDIDGDYTTYEKVEDFIKDMEYNLEQNSELNETILTERKTIFKSNGAYTGEVKVVDLHNDMQEVTLSQIGVTDEDKFLNTIQKCKTSDDILKVLRKFSNSKIGWAAEDENDKSCFCKGYSTDRNNDFVALRAVFFKKRKADSDDSNTLNLIDVGKYKKAVADVYKSMVSELGEEQALELIKNFATTADKHYSKLDLGESLNGKLKEEKIKMINESRENRRYSVEDNLQKAVNHYKEWSKCNDGEIITEDYINKDMWRLKRVSNLHNIPVDRIKSELLKDNRSEDR